MNKDTEEDHRKCPGLLTRCIERFMLCSQNTPPIETKNFRNTLIHTLFNKKQYST